jgi:hypothetical protein
MLIFICVNSLRKVCHFCMCRSVILNKNEDRWSEDNLQGLSPIDHLNWVRPRVTNLWLLKDNHGLFLGKIDIVL